jgi:hypothetical protein
MPKQDRNRGEADNGFDDLKNQWRSGGYTSVILPPAAP